MIMMMSMMMIMMMMMMIYDDGNQDQETVTKDDCSTVKRVLSLISWVGCSDIGAGLSGNGKQGTRRLLRYLAKASLTSLENRPYMSGWIFSFH